MAAWAAGEVTGLRHSGNLGAAVALAVLSTGCYATSAVLQEQEASRQVAAARLVRGLIRRPRWWLAVSASALAAALHIAALALGPLSVVQPLAVLTLVLALPLGACWSGRVVSGRQWWAAAAVVTGLATALAVTSGRARHTHSPLLSVPAATGLTATMVIALVVTAKRSTPRAALVARAGAAGTCYGFASAMTRIAAIGAVTVWVAAAMAVCGAAVGFTLAQLAYRNGGLGAPPATLILIDPLVAVLLGVTVLGEPFPTAPSQVVLAVMGLAMTAGGIWALAQSSVP